MNSRVLIFSLVVLGLVVVAVEGFPKRHDEEGNDKSVSSESQESSEETTPSLTTQGILTDLILTHYNNLICFHHVRLHPRNAS
jgi:hypothetical protein